jgi:hypothetical protein
MATGVSAEARARWSAGGARRLALWLLGETASLTLAYELWQLVALVRGGGRGSDFLSFYAAGRIVAEGQGSHLYDLGLQRAAQAAAGTGWATPAFLPYPHPPFLALLLAPLAALPYEPAYVAWGLVLGAATVTAVVALVLGAGFRGGHAVAACLVIAACAPLTVAVLQGQPNPFILLGLALGLAAWIRGRDGLAGALFGLGLVKPHLIVLVPLVLLAARSRRGLAGFLATAAAMVALPTLAFGWAPWPRLAALYLPGLLGSGSLWDGFGPPLNASGLLGALPAGPRLAVSAAALALSGWLLRRGRLPRGDDLAVAVAASVAFVPHAFTHDLSLLVVPACWAAGRLVLLARRRETGAPLRPSAALLAALGLAAPWLAVTLGLGNRLAGQWSTLLVLGLVLAVVGTEKVGSPRRTLVAA